MSWWFAPWWIVANAALGHVVWQWWRKRRKSRNRQEAVRRMERIARLELELGVGLVYAMDWLRSQPSRVTVPYMQRLADEGNGSVERRCWSCDKTYRPGEHEHYYREPRDNAIPDRLCPKCAAHVQAELGAL